MLKWHFLWHVRCKVWIDKKRADTLAICLAASGDTPVLHWVSVLLVIRSLAYFPRSATHGLYRMVLSMLNCIAVFPTERNVFYREYL